MIDNIKSLRLTPEKEQLLDAILREEISPMDVQELPHTREVCQSTIEFPNDYDVILEAANEILGGTGVEALPCPNCWDSYVGDSCALYVNMGDTYKSTVLFDIGEASFKILSWGDFLEEHEASHEEL